jgi:uroporphyrinogen-III synthase
MSAGRLEGVRVLVTRPRDRAADLCFLLEDEGAEVVHLPLLELTPPSDERGLRSAAEQIHRYAWVAFASPSAVDALWEACREAGTQARLSVARLAAVGPGTARALESRGLTVTCTAGESTGAGLYAAMREALRPEDEVLLPAAEEGRRELEDSLVQQGVRVTRVAAYRSAPTARDDSVLAGLLAEPPRVAMLGSPRTAEALAEQLGAHGPGWLAAVKLVAIGPTTAKALEDLGWVAAGVAERPTPEGLVDAAVRALG